MDQFGSALGIIGGVLSIVLLLGGVLVFFKGSYSRARIEALRADVSDYKNREEVLVKRVTALESEVAHLKSENGILRDMVTQRAEVDAVMAAVDMVGRELHSLGALLNEHHQEAMVVWREGRK
jgi:cell division protein FtsB